MGEKTNRSGAANTPSAEEVYHATPKEFLFALDTLLEHPALHSSRKSATKGSHGEQNGATDNAETDENSIAERVSRHFALFKTIQQQTGLPLVPVHPSLVAGRSAEIIEKASAVFHQIAVWNLF